VVGVALDASLGVSEGTRLGKDDGTVLRRSEGLPLGGRFEGMVLGERDGCNVRAAANVDANLVGRDVGILLGSWLSVVGASFLSWKRDGRLVGASVGAKSAINGGGTRSRTSLSLGDGKRDGRLVGASVVGAKSAINGGGTRSRTSPLLLLLSSKTAFDSLSAFSPSLLS
jgi:hypothetical protein